jgi:putative ATPase
MENNSRIPLAERMRPQSLEDIVGQQQLLHEHGILPEIIKNREPVSLILWGPPGTGKTTLARVIAKEVDAEFVLPHVESGLITLIGATTENPSFEVITPLLSRSRVLVLQPLTKDEIITILRRALTELKKKKSVSDEALDYLAELSSGDARVALGNLELALALGKNNVTPETVKTAAQKKVPGYDKKGDMHYDVISAFIKSMRGSNVDATLYYLARMIDAGEDPKFIARRMVIFASEDIGLAGNGALGLALTAFQSVERIGMPESAYILFHVATALAKSEKSRATTEAMHRAQELANMYPDAPVPLHLRNAPTKLMRDIGYGKDYKWEADFKHPEGFLPDELQNKRIF